MNVYLKQILEFAHVNAGSRVFTRKQAAAIGMDIERRTRCEEYLFVYAVRDEAGEDIGQIKVTAFWEPQGGYFLHEVRVATDNAHKHLETALSDLIGYFFMCEHEAEIWCSDWHKHELELAA